ncbi:ABC transporter substrate-binding protein [Gryllotalpicola protaetiae]|nr:extracellular solute-binding protein [Gryllotalpicola protaetiae]
MFASPTRSRRKRGRLALAGAILVTAATALTACASGSSASTGGSTTKADSGIKGTIRVSAETDQPFLQDAADAFEKKYPGTTVTLVESPSNTYQTTVRAQLAAGHAPDVMFVWGGSGNAMASQLLGQAGLLEDLSDRPWAKSIGPTANGLVSYGGKLYALNTYENPTGVYYNTALMDKLGQKVPTTFPQLLSWCKAVAAKGVTPIALGNQTGYLDTEVPLELANTIAYSKDPDFAKQVTASDFNWTNSTEWKSALTQALKEYMQMNDAKCFEPNSTGYSDQQANSLVATEKAVGVDIIASAIPSVQADNPKLKYDMFEIPATSKASDTYLTANTGAAYGVNKASTNKKTAIAFVDFMAQSDNLTKAAKANFGLPYTATKDTPVTSDMKGISDLYHAGKTALWQTNFWPNANVKQTMIAQDQNLILGKADINAVVDAIQQSFAGK